MTGPRETLRSTFLSLLAVVAALGAAAQEQPPAAEPPGRFSGAERVTVVDLPADLGGPGLAGALRSLALAPRPEQLVARVGGVERPVVAVEPARSAREAPWTVLLYFDLALSDRLQVRWAAGSIAERLAELTALGRVELVVADPDPRTVVPPTRDREPLEQALAALELGVYAAEAEDLLVSRRLAMLEATGATFEIEPSRASATESTPAGGGGLAAGLAASEAHLVRERLDALLLAAVARSGAGPDGGRVDPARRALLLSTGGWDLEPGLPHAPRGDLAPATAETARTLAAYGWTVLPLLAPEAAGTTPGPRIGKWRIVRPDIAGGWVPLITAVREDDRDPERARAWLELARARWNGGEIEGAGDAAEKALIHFADDPRTASEQAEALVVLAAVHRRLGDPQRARRAVLGAAARAPEAVADHPALLAAVRHPEGAAEALAGELGAVARSREDLARAVTRLERQGVVSIQLVGLPDGQLHPLTLEEREGGPVRSSGWIRFGTPETVAAARGRRLLENVYLPDADLLVAAALEPAPEAAGLRVHARAELSGLPAEQEAAVLRTTVAVPGSPGAPHPSTVVHLSERLAPAPRGLWAWRRDYPLEAGVSASATSWAVVLVEDLISGRWGATFAERVD